MRISPLPFALFIVAALLTGNEAHATETADLTQTLAMSEAAYEQVDYVATYKLACSGLQIGNATLQQTLRLHLLCAMASAALEKTDEARGHFKIVLAIHPELHLDRELSPKIRSPYLEAQGYWSHYEDRLTVKATLRSTAQRILLKVIDPAHLGYKIRIFWRRPRQAAFRSLDRESAPVVAVESNSTGVEDGLEYYASLLDERGNVIAELGSEAEPLEILPRQPTAAASTKPQPAPRKSTSAESRSLWVPVALVGAGAVAAGLGAYFNVIRENAAHKWNGAECENPGLSRGEQCASVDSDRRKAERAAIALYATGGILLTTGVVLWAIPGASHSPRGRAGSGDAPRFSCGTALPLSVSCSGRF